MDFPAHLTVPFTALFIANQDRDYLKERLAKFQHGGALLKSIHENGIMQALAVLPAAEGRYRVVAGMRRYDCLAQLSKRNDKRSKEICAAIPINVHLPMKEEDVQVARICESDVVPCTPAQIAEAMLRLKERFNMTTRQIATATGRSERYVQRYIKLAKENRKSSLYVLKGTEDQHG